MCEKDMVEKTLGSYNDVFADIVNGLLFHGREVVKEGSLADAQPVSVYKADGRLREQERDVSKYWCRTEEKRINVRLAFLGIENQTEYDRDMPVRVIGYDGASYRAQLAAGRKERYPVLTLVLSFSKKRWGKNRRLYDVLEIPEELKPYISDYRICVFEIPYLPEEAVGWFRSDFRIAADYFIHSRENADYRPEEAQAFRHTDELLKLMAVMTNDDRYEDILKEGGERPKNMCEVLDRAEARGREEGMEIGREETLLTAAKNMMEAFRVTAMQALEVLKVPAEERQKYMEKLGN